jgi:N-ethylmaleimide reductase
MTKLLISPASLAPIGKVQSRVVMAAMTRSHAPQHLATPEIAAYYARRAAGGTGLILTEGVIIDPSADGYKDVPYIATHAQAASWRPVIEGVHQSGGRIFCQLWHCGRISHSDFTGGRLPVSSTAKSAEGMNRQNNKPYGEPHALTAQEMPGIYKMFSQAATHALSAGFDGVQLHMGHGYLVDQFFDARVNDRTDSYGGSIANRCRFAVELLEEVLAVAGPEKTMVRISPARDMGGPYDWPDMPEMLAHLVPAFSKLGLRMLDVSCANADYYKTSARVIDLVRPQWRGLLIGGASLTLEQAEKEIASGRLDMVTWGRALIANPDLVAKVKEGQKLVEFDREMLARLQ